MKLEVIFLFELFVNIYVWKKRKQKIKNKNKKTKILTNRIKIILLKGQ